MVVKITYNFWWRQENGFLEGKNSFLVSQKIIGDQKQPINEIIGRPTLADAKDFLVPNTHNHIEDFCGFALPELH